MQWKVSTIALIGMIALFGTSCGTIRSVRSSTDLRTTESRTDTLREQVLVAVHDSVTITQTVTITENEQGDTVKVVQVTDRDRVRERAAVRDKEEKVIVRTDTVYVAVRDSTDVGNYGAMESRSRASPVVLILKWMVAVIVCLIAYKLMGLRG